MCVFLYYPLVCILIDVTSNKKGYQISNKSIIFDSFMFRQQPSIIISKIINEHTY